jgi:hypothetical protein
MKFKKLEIFSQKNINFGKVHKLLHIFEDNITEVKKNFPDSYENLSDSFHKNDNNYIFGFLKAIFTPIFNYLHEEETIERPIYSTINVYNELSKQSFFIWDDQIASDTTCFWYKNINSRKLLSILAKYPKIKKENSEYLKPFTDIIFSGTHQQSNIIFDIIIKDNNDNNENIDGNTEYITQTSTLNYNRGCPRGKCYSEDNDICPNFEAIIQLSDLNKTKVKFDSILKNIEIDFANFNADDQTSNNISAFCKEFKEYSKKLNIDLIGELCFDSNQEDIRTFALAISLVLYDHINLNRKLNTHFRLAFIVPKSISVFSINPFFTIFKMSEDWINSELKNSDSLLVPFYLDGIYLILTRINSEISILSKTAIWKEKLYLQQLKTAIISILVDSYAHNISAHSLAALKWWIEQRHKMLDKRFFIPEEGLTLEHLYPYKFKITPKKLSETTEKYYEALGLKDSTYNKDYFSLFDFFQFIKSDKINSLFSWSTEVHQKGNENLFKPRFPVPIDHALFPFFRFLRDKGAFWSGVTRDMAFGGETKTWYKILWEDFANNPLYLGTIAKSEGITKINIHLKVISNENKVLEGRFVTIDMSVMDYESDMAESPTFAADIHQYDPNNKTIKIDEDYVKKLKTDTENCNKDIDDQTQHKIVPFVESDKYSKYAFIKLGEKFAAFRELLNNEENYSVFLPGGIVGEHALFTIFENQIRNIKHYKSELKDIQANGINFWISIEEDNLVDTNTEDKQLFKVGVWLGHTTKLKTDEKRYLVFDITKSTTQSILDKDTGAPRMGGNSQDKACAAMLFNNQFTSAERLEFERDKKYFPWIRFATVCEGKKEFELNYQFDTSSDNINNIKEEYSKILNEQSEGILKKYFYLWRGKNILKKEDIQSDSMENPARAKFLIGENWDTKSKTEARNNGIIRILETKSNNSDDINTLYEAWLPNWLNSYSPDSPIIAIVRGNNEYELSNAGALRWLNDTIAFYYDESIDDEAVDPCKNACSRLKLSHGNEKDFHCNVRLHGVFFQKFFTESTIDDIASKTINVNLDVNDKIELITDKEEINRNKTFLYEFIEATLTEITIFDNRVFDRFKIYPKKKIEMFENSLFLKVYNEDKKTWDIKKDSFSNFLIMHLSFIESMGYKEDIEKFIETEIKELISEDNFILVITSGRGRKDWETTLQNENYKKKVIFKPIESILSSVESGISYNDHFDIKYYLAKLLFGS